MDGSSCSCMHEIMDYLPVRFGQLSIKGFRRLRDLQLDLRPL